jgi:hypothetical protein
MTEQLEHFNDTTPAKKTKKKPTRRPKRNNWQRTKNDNIMIKLRIAAGDDIIPYRLFIKKIDSPKFNGYMMQLAQLTYNQQDNQFSCDFDSAKPTWFTPQEYAAFLQALGEL